jgi:hypothetical protein
MPQIGWTIRGTDYTLDGAIEIAKKNGEFSRFPPAALRTMYNKDRDPYVLSPSSASYCLRQRILRTQHDYYLDPDSIWKMARGTAIHGYLDENIEGQSEQHLKMVLELVNQDTGEIHEVNFAGTFDYYEPDTETMYDYKTTKTFFQFVKGTGKTAKHYPTPEHELQINLYAMLARHHNMPVKRAFIWYVSAGDGRKLVPVPMWPADEVEQIAYNLASHIIEPRETGILPMAYQPDEPEYWQCRFCCVSDVCREKEKEGL